MARRSSSAHAVHTTFEDYSSAAITTGTNKREWTAPFHGRIVGVSARTEAATSGTSTLDVNINGTSIFAAANRPTKTTTGAGEFTAGNFDSTASGFIAGDVIGYDVDVAGTGHSRFSISISLGV